MLSTPYPYDKAKLIVREMAEILMFRLTEKKLVTESLTLEISYDRENVDNGGYRSTQTNRYGRPSPRQLTAPFDLMRPPIWAAPSSTKVQSCLSASPTRR